jgi:hypothetical protein
VKGFESQPLSIILYNDRQRYVSCLPVTPADSCLLALYNVETGDSAAAAEEEVHRPIFCLSHRP